MENRFEINILKFNSIPGALIAYWFSDNLIKVFEQGVPLKRVGDTRQGMATSDNNRFLRFWYEISDEKIMFDCHNSFDCVRSGMKWFPYNKGGEYHKWYGNQDYVINYFNDGEEVKGYAAYLYKTPTRTIKSMSEYFKKCISWSKISSGNVAFRFYPEGFIFDVAGCCIFYNGNETQMTYDFAFLNSCVSQYILKALSPTLNYEAGQIASLPIIVSKHDVGQEVSSNLEECKSDWDSFETSWGFKKHPLV